MNNTQNVQISTFSVHGFALTVAINLAGVAGNALLIISHIVDPLKLLKSKSSAFVFGIIIADMLLTSSALCALVLFQYFYDNGTKLVHVVDVLSQVISSSFSVSLTLYLFLAFERFCSVAFPLWHHANITTRSCHKLVVRTWVVWVIARVGFFILGRTLHWKSNVKIKLLLVELIFNWVLFLLTQCVYIASCLSIRKQSRELQARCDLNETTERTMKLRLKNENNFLVTIAIVCFILAVTKLPLMTMAFMLQFEWSEYSEKNSDKVVVAFPSFYIWGVAGISLKSAINILIYIWRLPRYQKTFKKLYCYC